MGETRDRPSFLRSVSLATAALPLLGAPSLSAASSGLPRQPFSSAWASQMGFALFTVRDLLAKDADG